MSLAQYYFSSTVFSGDVTGVPEVLVEVLSPLFRSTGVLVPAERPRTPTPARLQRPAGRSSGRDAAETRRPQPATKHAATLKLLQCIVGRRPETVVVAHERWSVPSSSYWPISHLVRLDQPIGQRDAVWQQLIDDAAVVLSVSGGIPVQIGRQQPPRLVGSTEHHRRRS